MSQLSDYLIGAENAAKEAGKILQKGGDEIRKINFSDATDVKLKADEDSEKLIRKILEAASDFPVVGEEFGGNKNLPTEDRLYWVVDPLDGTFNYLRGSSQCAVSIGLLRGTDPVLGVVYDFNQDTLYSGIVGEGFWINGERQKPRWANSIGQAALATGFPAGMDKSPEQMQKFIERIAPYKKIRMVGSAALAMAYVASSTFDVYFEETIRLWDVAAGAALIKANGGILIMEASSTGKSFAYDVWGAGKEEFIPKG